MGFSSQKGITFADQIDKVMTDFPKHAAWILLIFANWETLTMQTLWIAKIRLVIHCCSSQQWSTKPILYSQRDRLEGVLQKLLQSYRQDRGTVIEIPQLTLQHVIFGADLPHTFYS